MCLSAGQDWMKDLRKTLKIRSECTWRLQRILEPPTCLSRSAAVRAVSSRVLRLQHSASSRSRCRASWAEQASSSSRRSERPDSCRSSSQGCWKAGELSGSWRLTNRKEAWCEPDSQHLPRTEPVLQLCGLKQSKDKALKYDPVYLSNNKLICED